MCRTVQPAPFSRSRTASRARTCRAARPTARLAAQASLSRTTDPHAYVLPLASIFSIILLAFLNVLTKFTRFLRLWLYGRL